MHRWVSSSWMNIPSWWHGILIIATLSVAIDNLAPCTSPFLLLKSLSPLGSQTAGSCASLTKPAQSWKPVPSNSISFDTHRQTRWLFSQRILNNTTQYRFYITPSFKQTCFWFIITINFHIWDSRCDFLSRDKFPLIMQRKVCKLTVYSVLGMWRALNEKENEYNHALKNKWLHHKRKNKHYVFQTDTMPDIPRTVCRMLLLVMISLATGFRAYGVTVTSFDTHRY